MQTEKDAKIMESPCSNMPALKPGPCRPVTGGVKTMILTEAEMEHWRTTPGFPSWLPVIPGAPAPEVQRALRSEIPHKAPGQAAGVYYDSNGAQHSMTSLLPIDQMGQGNPLEGLPIEKIIAMQKMALSLRQKHPKWKPQRIQNKVAEYFKIKLTDK